MCVCVCVKRLLVVQREKRKYFSINSSANHFMFRPILFNLTHIYIYIYIVKVKLATLVEGNKGGRFPIAITLRCKGGRYSSFPWIASLYP